MNLSVVIPTWNEALNLSATLSALPGDAEVIVVDGGSTDRTAAIATAEGARLVPSERGRARQMNRGAALANGEAVLFLHADGILGEGAGEAVSEAFSDPSVVGGSFRLRIRSGSPALRLVALGSNLRARYLGMPYGDQGIFVRRSTLRALGGFPDVPFLEDVILIRKLRRVGRLRQIPISITTGARHWEDLGAARTTLLNWTMVAAYFAGLSPERLEPYYRRFRGDARRGRSPGGAVAQAD